MSDIITDWENLNLYSGKEDNINTDKMFYANHPELVNKPIRRGSALVREWLLLKNYVIQNKYNVIIENAVSLFPMISCRVLKALLIRESRFNPTVINSYGYAGIAQFGVTSGKAEGLVINMQIDERLDPTKAIPAAVKHLQHKYEAIKPILNKHRIFDTQEIVKFILASYNGGQSTIICALNSCDSPPTSWHSIYNPAIDMLHSPLYSGTHLYFSNISGKDISIAKWKEIGNYPNLIMKLANKE